MKGNKRELRVKNKNQENKIYHFIFSQNGIVV